MLPFYAISTLSQQIISTLAISTTQFALLTGSIFASAALLSPSAGLIVHKIGNRKSLAVLFGLSALSLGLISITSNLLELICAFLIAGSAIAIANPATNQTINTIIKPQHKAMVIGFKQSGVQLAALVAGITLPTLSIYLGWKYAFTLWSLPALLLICVTYLNIPNNKQHQAITNHHKPTKLLLLLVTAQFFAALVISSFLSFFAIYAGQLAVSNHLIGYMISCFGMMGIVCRIILTLISTKFNDESMLLVILFAGAAFSLFIIKYASSTNYLPLWLAVIGMGLTATPTNAIAISMIIRDANNFGNSAYASGILSSGFFAGFALGPTIFNFFTTNKNFTNAWLFLICSLLIAAVFSVKLYLMRRNL